MGVPGVWCPFTAGTETRLRGCAGHRQAPPTLQTTGAAAAPSPPHCLVPRGHAWPGPPLRISSISAELEVG